MKNKTICSSGKTLTSTIGHRGLHADHTLVVYSLCLRREFRERVAKIFWFYKVIIVAGIACIPLAWMRPFRFSITDLLVLLYAGYTLCNDYFAGQSLPPNEPLHLDHRHVFHIPTADNIRPARFTHAALLLTGAIEATWGLAHYTVLPPPNTAVSN